MHQQILFLGNHHLLGTQGQQALAFFGGLGCGDHLHAQGLAQLHKGWAGLSRFDPCQLDIGEIGNQQRRVVNTGLNRRQHIRITGQGRARHEDQFAIHRVVVGALGRKTGDLVTDRQVLHSIAERRDHTGHLMTDTSRQAGMAGGHGKKPGSAARARRTN